MKSTRTGRKYVSAEGVKFVKDIRISLREQMEEKKIKKYEGKVEMTVKFYFNNKRKNDLDNFTKPFLDAISDIIIEDDRYIYKLLLEKEDGCEEYRIEFSIKEIIAVE
jgi:Holliday junction resolvase RusA-like endonuclease